MDWLFAPLSDIELQGWEVFFDDWFLVIALGILVVELIRYAIQGKFTWG